MAVNPVAFGTIGVQSTVNVHLFFKILVHGTEVSRCQPFKNLLLVLRTQAEAPGYAGTNDALQDILFRTGFVKQYGGLSTYRAGQCVPVIRHTDDEFRWYGKLWPR